MARVLTFVGTGTLRTWQEPASLETGIMSEMIRDGWGVSRVQLQNRRSLTSPSTLLLGALGNMIVPTYEYQIGVSISVPNAENVERVRQGLLPYLSQYFDISQFYLQDDQIHTITNTGQVEVANTYPSTWDNFFGQGTSVTGAGAQILGLSGGTIIAIAVGFLLINSLTGKR